MNDLFFNDYFMFGLATIYDRLPLDEPPTLYKILDSAVNAGKTLFDPSRVPTTKIASAARTFVFNFDYPLSAYVDKKSFEELFIKHFLMRRIGMKTFSAFKIQLDARLNEIMPAYNPMFDAMGEKFDLFSGGNYTREYTEETKNDREQNTTTEGTTNTTTDNRFSDTPQSRLQDIQNGTYMTEYQYNQGDSSTSGEGSLTENATGGREYVEKYTSDIPEKTQLLQTYNANAMKIYQRIFADCDNLFYQLF